MLLPHQHIFFYSISIVKPKKSSHQMIMKYISVDSAMWHILIGAVPSLLFIQLVLFLVNFIQLVLAQRLKSMYIPRLLTFDKTKLLCFFNLFFKPPRERKSIRPSHFDDLEIVILSFGMALLLFFFQSLRKRKSIKPLYLMI